MSLFARRKQSVHSSLRHRPQPGASSSSSSLRTMDSPTSDTPRQSLLGSINFLTRANRPRAATTSNNANNTETPTIPPSNPLPSSASTPGHRRRQASANTTVAAQTQAQNTTGLGYMLRRRRSATALAERTEQNAAPPTGPTHRIRLVPHLESHRSLHFDAISRDVRQGDAPLRIGRFTERSSHSANSGNKLAFKSKVVSRGHAEIWYDAGIFYIKDTKSSSGTFLNHIRLSPPNTESRPFSIKDGDVLQLGVDYQGGTEEIYRCVKMRVELGREWQTGVNAFNTNALLQLKTLSTVPAEKAAKANITDCCICLFQVTVCQSLFIAPCSHVYHYKCIRPLLEMHHPGFSCPLCRTFADLEADVEVEAETREMDDASLSPNLDLTPNPDPNPNFNPNPSSNHNSSFNPSPNTGVSPYPSPNPHSHPEEDVDMGLEDAEGDEVDPGAHHLLLDEEDPEDLDAEQSSSSPDAAHDMEAMHDHSPRGGSQSIPVPRQMPGGSAGFPGAEATPLNNTFLATLGAALVSQGGTSTASQGGGGVHTGLVVSDEGESADENANMNAVVGKRKR